ncbi:hypothetical protein Echvi_1023 [Echinicola vietnamensis DSM 17526]|uniref:Uncharacterized protein n=1 Tax=Echinicola vietnamensis (strain DSM 17526 / LMG 23754 / KMM 6221) TaxID=926556 RepID=L0FTQ2_ECHVK|nr:hypothetical protein Echvi_1023 [Echinicola vietnamensis DSM 17526]
MAMEVYLLQVLRKDIIGNLRLNPQLNEGWA